MSPKEVPLNTIGRPIINPTVDVTVMILPVLDVSVALVTTDGVVIVIVGGFAYPRILPNKSISSPGGSVPSLTCTMTGLLVLGLLYVTGILTHTLSIVPPVGYVFIKLPLGVVNCGIADPDIVNKNVLSLMFPRLSVALIAKVDVILLVTNDGVPDINPVLDIDSPLGNVPLNNVYVMVVAGATADADS
jgi:hypothetical protein